jgi:hypothetical protein
MTVAGNPAATKANPDWTREEHILALDLYMRLRGTSYSDDHVEVIALSETLKRWRRFAACRWPNIQEQRRLARLRGRLSV